MDAAISVEVLSAQIYTQPQKTRSRYSSTFLGSIILLLAI